MSRVSRGSRGGGEEQKGGRIATDPHTQQWTLATTQVTNACSQRQYPHPTAASGTRLLHRNSTLSRTRTKRDLHKACTTQTQNPGECERSGTHDAHNTLWRREGTRGEGWRQKAKGTPCTAASTYITHTVLSGLVPIILERNGRENVLF